jgi:hypothetical protein
VLTRGWDTLILGVLPLAAAGFLGWIVGRSLQGAPASQVWSLIAVIGVGVLLMLAGRFILRSPFFGIGRESDADGRESDADGRESAADG